jgi:hypothetical protein
LVEERGRGGKGERRERERVKGEERLTRLSGWFTQTFAINEYPQLLSSSSLTNPDNSALLGGKIYGGDVSWVQFEQQIIDTCVSN